MRLKSELYKDKQIKIMNNIIDIIDFDKNNSITLYDLDNDIIKQNKIIELIPEIKKYFKCNCVKSLLAPEKVKRVYLSIIRYVTKIEYNMVGVQYLQLVNDEKIRTTKYIFIKKQ